MMGEKYSRCFVPSMADGFNILNISFSKSKLTSIASIIIFFIISNVRHSTCANLSADLNGKFSRPKLNPFREIPVPCFITNVAQNSQRNHTLAYWQKKLGWDSFEQFSNVSCLNNAKQPVPGIPDLILNGTTYSSIDFQGSLDHQSSVSFAIDKFIFQLKQKDAVRSSSNKQNDHTSEDEDDEESDPTQEEQQKNNANIPLLKLMTYWKLYGAMDIALRTANNPQSDQILRLLKGPGFVLNFQIARLEGKTRDVAFHLSHILNNCLNCTGVESKRLVLLARASGVKDDELSNAMGREPHGASKDGTNQSSDSYHLRPGLLWQTNLLLTFILVACVCMILTPSF